MEQQKGSQVKENRCIAEAMRWIDNSDG